MTFQRRVKSVPEEFAPEIEIYKQGLGDKSGRLFDELLDLITPFEISDYYNKVIDTQLDHLERVFGAGHTNSIALITQKYHDHSIPLMLAALEKPDVLGAMHGKKGLEVGSIMGMLFSTCTMDRNVPVALAMPDVAYRLAYIVMQVYQNTQEWETATVKYKHLIYRERPEPTVHQQLELGLPLENHRQEKPFGMFEGMQNMPGVTIVPGGIMFDPGDDATGLVPFSGE